MVELSTRWIEAVRRGVVGSTRRSASARNLERPAPPRSTRLTCFGLFILALALAGAAGRMMHASAEVEPYLPILLRGCAVDDSSPFEDDPEDLLLLLEENEAESPAASNSGSPFDDDFAAVLAIQAEIATEVEQRDDRPPPPPKPVLSRPKPAAGSDVAPPAQPKPKTNGKASSKPAGSAPSPTFVGPPSPSVLRALAERDAMLPPPPPSNAKVISIRDRAGKLAAARFYGMADDRVAVLMPDGQIAFADGMIESSERFIPATMDQVEAALLAEEFRGFQVTRTRHYLVLYDGSERFAKASADVLEDLYVQLGRALREEGFAVHETEFPLVAVIYATEADFRARKQVANEVQAYYEILSNRIFLYEKSSRDAASPELAMLRKPQTVAHEGAHQILQNIGVQPRLADWPLWLIEGFAEYCSPPKLTKNGNADWAGLNRINPLHMATIRDLDDPLSTFVAGSNADAIRRVPGQSWIETLVSKPDLTPTDYALSWALVHYLVNRRLPEFLDYLETMSKRAPFESRTPEEHLADFEKAFGKNLKQLDATVATYLSKIKKFDALPYYVVMIEQPVGRGVRRSAMVSQSPSVIRQWIDSATARGGAPRWRVLPHPTRARAVLAAREWVGGG